MAKDKNTSQRFNEELKTLWQDFLTTSPDIKTFIQIMRPDSKFKLNDSKSSSDELNTPDEKILEVYENQIKQGILNLYSKEPYKSSMPEDNKFKLDLAEDQSSLIIKDIRQNGKIKDLDFRAVSLQNCKIPNSINKIFVPLVGTPSENGRSSDIFSKKTLENLGLEREEGEKIFNSIRNTMPALLSLPPQEIIDSVGGSFCESAEDFLKDPNFIKFSLQKNSELTIFANNFLSSPLAQHSYVDKPERFSSIQTTLAEKTKEFFTTALNHQIIDVLNNPEKLAKVANAGVPEKNSPELANAEAISAYIAKGLGLKDKESTLKAVVFSAILELPKIDLNPDDRKAIAATLVENIINEPGIDNLTKFSPKKLEKARSETIFSKPDNAFAQSDKKQQIPQRAASVQHFKKESNPAELQEKIDKLKQTKVSQPKLPPASPQQQQHHVNLAEWRKSSQQHLAKPNNPEHYANFSAATNQKPPVGDKKFTNNPNINPPGGKKPEGRT